MITAEILAGATAGATLAAALQNTNAALFKAAIESRKIANIRIAQGLQDHTHHGVVACPVTVSLGRIDEIDLLLTCEIWILAIWADTVSTMTANACR